MNFLTDSLERRLIFITGKGGVGKTTLAWSTALACSKHGKRVAVAAWNPYGSEKPPFDFPGIDFVGLETLACFREYILKILRFEKIYQTIFDHQVLRSFVQAAPGLSETVISGKIWSLVDSDTYDLVVVDLPSSGHTVTFFQSPLGIYDLFPVGFIHRESKKIIEFFQSEQARIDFVTLPEELPTTETRELYKSLRTVANLPFGFIHLNHCTPDFKISDSVSLPENILARYWEELAEQKRFAKELEDLGRPVHSVLTSTSLSSHDVINEIAKELSRC